MTNDEFQSLFGADADELAAAAAAVEAEVAAEAAAAKQVNGFHWDRNQENENGHLISIYKLVMGGKVILWFRVNNALTVEGVPGLPAGTTAHPIEVCDAKSTRTIATKGFAVMMPSKLGTRINGRTVASYVMPRLPRFLGELYGV